jgi:hypothetical protein
MAEMGQFSPVEAKLTQDNNPGSERREEEVRDIAIRSSGCARLYISRDRELKTSSYSYGMECNGITEYQYQFGDPGNWRKERNGPEEVASHKAMMEGRNGIEARELRII